MRLFKRNKKPVVIKLHRPNADVYVDGRYLQINARLSLKSARDRKIISELIHVVGSELNHAVATSLLKKDVQPRDVPRETHHDLSYPHNPQGQE